MEDFYCQDCGSCGEDGCCPDWKCKHSEKCLYPYSKNHFIQKVSRILYRITKNYKLSNGFYRLVQNAPFWFYRYFICIIIGHSPSPFASNLCERCGRICKGND